MLSIAATISWWARLSPARISGLGHLLRAALDHHERAAAAGHDEVDVALGASPRASG